MNILFQTFVSFPGYFVYRKSFLLLSGLISNTSFLAFSLSSSLSVEFPQLFLRKISLVFLIPVSIKSAEFLISIFYAPTTKWLKEKKLKDESEEEIEVCLQIFLDCVTVMILTIQINDLLQFSQQCLWIITHHQCTVPAHCIS